MINKLYSLYREVGSDIKYFERNAFPYICPFCLQECGYYPKIWFIVFLVICFACVIYFLLQDTQQILYVPRETISILSLPKYLP